MNGFLKVSEYDEKQLLLTFPAILLGFCTGQDTEKGYVMPKHYAGKKVTRSHTTAIACAQIVLDAILRHSNVTKVSLGKITSSINGRKRRISIAKVPVGLKVNAYDLRAMQTLFVHTMEPDAIASLLREAFS